jgi:hypothetical protein
MLTVISIVLMDVGYTLLDVCEVVAHPSKCACYCWAKSMASRIQEPVVILRWVVICTACEEWIMFRALKPLIPNVMDSDPIDGSDPLQ